MRALVVGEQAGRKIIIEQSLLAGGHTLVAKLTSARRLLFLAGKRRVELIVLDLLSPDLATLSHIRRVADHLPCPILLLLQQGDTQRINACLQAGASVYVLENLSCAHVSLLVDEAISLFNRTQALQKEGDKANTTLEERIHIERAKSILMSRARVHENAAYQTLRKLAMNRNKHIAEIAYTIVAAEDLMMPRRGFA